MPAIEQRFNEAGMNYDTHTSEGNPMEAYKLIKNMENLSDYNLICVAGDDNTFQEVVNGMLIREDGVKLPLGFLPNECQSDILAALGIMSLELALDNIVKAECIGIDTTRVLLDHDNEASLPEDVEERYKLCRHMLSDSSLTMPTNVGMASKSWYSCYSLSIATWMKGLSCSFTPSSFKIEVDGTAIDSGNNVDTSILMVNNGKYSNGGCLVNPFAALNDGLIDLSWVRDPAYFGMFGFRELMNDAKVGGGIQAYKKHSIYMRGRKIKCTYVEQETEQDTEQKTPQPEPAEEPKEETPQENGQTAGGEEETKETKDTKETPKEPEIAEKYVGVDDCDLAYKKSVTWQCFPQNIELMLDTDNYFMEFNSFPELYTRDDEHEKYIVDQIVDDMWQKYDVDGSGDLDKEETKKMVQDICAAEGRPFKAA